MRRVEFASEEDLGRYLSWNLLRDANNPKDKEYGSAVIVSLNERVIGIYQAGVQP